MGFNLDPAKILMIFAFGLIILGPERLPRFARTLGAAWRDFQLYREKIASEIRQAIPDTDEITSPLKFLNDATSLPSKAVNTVKQSLLTPVTERPKPGLPRQEIDTNRASYPKQTRVAFEGSPLFLPEDPRLN
jgi:Sec-independent protein translocase protein TatA